MRRPTAEEVRAARHAAGLTQAAAAALVGATLRAWSCWEGGQRNCPPAKYALFMMLTKQWAP